jgi:ArsR family transcriptional regulator
MESNAVVAALGALAQGTRLEIFRRLVVSGSRGLSVGQIAEYVATAPATLSFHLKELVHAGLISARQEGRFIFYCANYVAMAELLAFLTENCCAGDGESCTTAVCKPSASRRAAKKVAKKSTGQGLTLNPASTRRSRSG